MIDTAKLKSPPLADDLVDDILKYKTMVISEGHSSSTGKREYRIAKGSIPGICDSKTSISIRWKEFRWERDLSSGRSTPKLYWCQPYMVIEGSVHKAMAGHNVHSGPDYLFQEATHWYVKHVSDQLQVDLPDARHWTVERVDWAESFLVGREAVREYLSFISMAHYPQRGAPMVYPHESVTWAGDTMSLKFYHKGTEFQKNDMKRVQATMGPQETLRLAQYADDCLRVEVSIHNRTLVADHGYSPTIGDISHEYLTSKYDASCAKVIRDNRARENIVRSYDSVLKRLKSIYTSREAQTLIGFWLQLAVVGEEKLYKCTNITTFQRNVKRLQSAGCSWQPAELTHIESSVPTGFRPNRSNGYWVRQNENQVDELLLGRSCATDEENQPHEESEDSS